MYPRVYDQQMRLLAILENAGEVGYSLVANDLSTAQLSLPTPDPKNAYMAAHNFVRIYDGDDEVGLFRIVSEPATSNAFGGWTQYALEHVIATLIDDVIFGYHEFGDITHNTAWVAQKILSYQTVTRWTLGVCQFTDLHTYKFENTDLLTALFTLPNMMTDEHVITYDTSQTPWVLNILKPGTTPDCEIRYRRNMQEIVRTMDAGSLVTRLYPLGYGEGVNQLTIKSVNSGVPYLDAASASTWGVKAAVYADTTIEDPATLKARGQALLRELSQPIMSYTASAVDLYRLTGYSWDNFLPGKYVHVIDEDSGINIAARIIRKSKADVYGDPGGLELEISNRVTDMTDSFNKIAAKQSIEELYSQGATNLYSQQFADNADATHPAVMRFYVPEGCVRINKMEISWSLAAFRAYSTAAASGGGSTETSGSGGSGTISTEAVDEEGSGLGRVSYVFDLGTSTHNGHTHGISGPGATATDTDGSHSHTVTDHYHDIVALHIPALSVELPAHTHSVTIPAHSHGITYGIYEGTTATTVSLIVDGTTVPAASITGTALDVCEWLSKDSDGHITRGTWHTIQIVPNALTRIEANLFAQCFIQSVGGGDY